ncbi:hypothetical protein CFC21_024658 [Triticum aestivum]|uniref:Uncharacterized protein n=2 Tax=Triticum aestivum TaxID=4565 RepID=A0A3B6CCR2_WHEAT|nr:hypothetical protein CFC21_024658 [Triticum aestivum]
MPPRPRAPSSGANSIAAEMGAQGIPARGGSPPPPVTTKHDASGAGEAQSCPVRSPASEGSDRSVEEKNSPGEIPWYDKLEDIDEEYRKYLSCVRFVNGHQIVVVPEGGLEAVPARVVDKSNGAGKKDGEEAAAHAASGEKGSSVGSKEKRKGKGKVAAITTSGKSRVRDYDPAHRQKVLVMDRKVTRYGQDEVSVPVGDKSDGAGKKDGVEAASRATSRKNGCGVGKKEKGKRKVAAITMGGPALKSRVADSSAHPQKGQKEKNKERKNDAKKMKVAAEPHPETLNTASGKEKVVVITTGEPALKSRVHDSTTHPQKIQKEKNGRKNGSKKMKVVEEEGKPSKELPVETLNIVKRKRKSNNVQNAESRTASTGNNRKPQLRRSARLMLSPPENDHK